MDEVRVKSILAPYSPPLSPSQMNAIAAEIVKVSAEEISEPMKKFEAPKPTHKKSRSHSHFVTGKLVDELEEPY